MLHMRRFLQHCLNPLHIYCRLCEVGISKGTAVRVSNLYERYIYRFYTSRS